MSMRSILCGLSLGLVLVVACTGPTGPAGAPGAPGVAGPPGTSGTSALAPDGAVLACAPNQQVACACPAAATGVQRCAADGMSFEACQCGDASVIAEAGADVTAPFSVADLPGLVVWLKGDKGIVDDLAKPGKVKRWVDQSGHGNDAAKVAANEGPTHDPSAVNGVDAVQFDVQTGLEIQDAPTLKVGTGDFALVFVAKVQSGSASGTLLWGKDNLMITFGAAPATLAVAAGGANASVALPSAAKFAFFAVRGTALRLEAGTNTASSGTSSGDLTPAADVISILPQTTGSLASVELAELLFVKGTLSDADLAGVRGYLTAKYGL